MATILKIKQKLSWLNSVLVKYAVGYIGLILACLMLMNIYPVQNMRTMLCESKRESMQNQKSVIASSLSVLANLNADEVKKVVQLLGDMDLTRMVITDTGARILYDSSNNEGNVGKYAVFPEIVSALKGNSVFCYNFTSAATMSRSAIPIMYRGKTIGAVYIYEYSVEEAELVAALQKNLEKISVIVFALAIFLALLFARFMNHRLSSVVGAIKHIGAGQPGYRMEVRGNDEFDQLGKEFNALAERLERTENLRRRFVSDASHELKTPLAGIRLLTDSIVQNDNIPPELMREFVSDIGMEAERLTRITEKLLELTRLDVKREDTHSAVNVADVVNESMKMLRTLAANKSVSLQCELAEGCIVWANTDDIHQVVFNLVENAIKYNVKDGSVRVLLYIQDDWVRLLIDDTGIGIPEEDIPHVFDRFYRVDKARNSDIGGSGLGLSIVKDMVEKHGGTVAVSRRENGGTRFSVSFPVFGEVKQAKK